MTKRKIKAYRMLYYKALSLDDVLIVPGKSDIKHRNSIDTSVHIGGFTLSVPFVAANMDTICGKEMAIAMFEVGGIGPLHRYNTIKEQTSDLEEIHEDLTILHGEYWGETTRPPLAASIGVKDYKERLASIHSFIDMVFIDVAHGHHVDVIECIKYVRQEHPDLWIVAGNVATYDGALDLYEAGAHIVKVGIGSGSMCTTRIITGVGVPQATAINSVYEGCKDLASKDQRLIIADGGIKNSGDIAKSLALGADLVMLGSLFAGTAESEGEVHDFGTIGTRKVYRGMASKDAQTHNHIKEPSQIVPEGVSNIVPYIGSVKEQVRLLAGGLQSAMSYVGARDLREFRDKAEVMEITTNGYVEGTPHGITGPERKGLG